MGYIRTLALALALIAAGSMLFTSSAFAAAVSGTGSSGMSSGSSDSNEFLLIKVATPEIIEIDVGETVTWRNLQRPKFPVVLISDDGLWDDQTLYYGKMFSYTFDEPGTYTFSVQDNSAMTGTIVVSEKKMLSVSDESEDEAMVVPEPVAMMEQVQERVQEQVMTGTNEFLIVRTVTPTALEVYAGDTVTWRNLQRPKFPVVLISEEGLWNDETIYYGKMFSYTFDEPGTYTFSVKDKPEMTGTVVVSEAKMMSVSDESDNGVMVAPGPVAMMGEEAGDGIMGEPVREQEKIREIDMTREILMIRVATPEVMEINAGETVTWKNLQRPKFPVVLVSEDDLWDDQTIYYGKVFSYTFEKAGIYTFSVQDNPAMSGTIVVS